MAGGLVKYRHLSRNSSARQALLRGLVTQLVAHEHIHTTYAKAKEAQRLAEKLITLAKRDNEPCRRLAQGILYTPNLYMPKLFGELKNRYAPREGGYTRVLRTEPKNNYDQAECAILELVDGPKDSRFMMTAKTVARDRLMGRAHTPITNKSVRQLTLFRGVDDFEAMVRRFMTRSFQTESPAAGDKGAAEEDVVSNAEAEAAALAQEQSAKAGRLVEKLAEGGSGASKKPVRQGGKERKR